VQLHSGALVLLAGLLVACGGGEERGPSDVAREFVATSSPAKCDLLAQPLLEQLTTENGEAARAACRRNVVRFPAPRDVRLRDGGGEAERDADADAAADAEVELLVDGREAGVKLNKRDGRWLIVGLGE
jgi:hypothetical protein